ncbi:trichohyalin [Drosophila navojoa]|nr:trichohyalin [Drosophila navojoa]
MQPDDMRYKEVKILRSPNGKLFLSKTLEEELKDEKHVLDFIESELQRSNITEMTPEPNERQRQALDERAELDRQKQQVSEWRAQRRMDDHKRAEQQVTKRMLKKAKEMKHQTQDDTTRNSKRQHRHQRPRPVHLNADRELDLDLELAELPQRSEGETLVGSQESDFSLDDILEEGKEYVLQLDTDFDEDTDATPRPSGNEGTIQELDNDLADSREQRRQFQNQCQNSSFYGNSNCLTPWTLYSNISSNLVDEMTRNIDAELHRSIAGFIKDFVDNETRTTNNQTN